MANQDDLKITKDLILQLVDHGNDLMEKADKEKSSHAAEKLAKRGIGYHEAATALLGRYTELYNELIEHPNMTKLRKAAKNWN